MRFVRALFAHQDDPYAGADMGSALRIGSILWALFVLLFLALWPFSPPDREIGDGGWLLGGGLAAMGILFSFSMRSQRVPWSFEMLLVSSYFALASIVVMQWLAGGVGAPYEKMLLIPLVFVAAVHPPQRVLLFLAVSGLALATPYLYDSWENDAFAGTFASFVLYGALALAGYLLMSGVRAQRLMLRRDEAEAREQARQDGLTEIGNRRGFEEAIANEIARAGRMDTPLSVAMADIERFKSVNDSFGHLEGDQILRRVAETISGELRVPDRVFRWGGDEFMLLLPGTPADGAEQLAERLRNLVNVRCKRPDGEPVQVRFGSAELTEGMTATELVEQADLALLASRAAR
jgi:diguanylate cyclase (GGDEF)-like protein